MYEIEKQTALGIGICGILLLICAVASLISGFIWIGIQGIGGYGVWSGIGLLVTGILGVMTWWKRNKGMNIGFLIMAIITIILATIQSIVSGILYTVFKSIADPRQCMKTPYGCECKGIGTIDAFCTDKYESLVNSLLAITIFSVIGAIVSFIGSIIGCMGACGTQQNQPGTVVIAQPAYQQASVQVVSSSQHNYAGPQPGYMAPQPAGYAQQPGYVVQPGYPPQQQAGVPPPAYK